jgi:hypothetical protein
MNNSNAPAFMMLFAVVILGISLASKVSGNTKAKDQVDMWAEANGYRVLSKQHLHHR